MKGVELFCASQAATAICLSMEQSSAASPSAAALLLGGGGGGRVIDRHNPIIKDSKRAPKPDPKSHPKNTKISRDLISENEPPAAKAASLSKLDAAAAAVKRRWSCTNPGDFLSPPGSTRYLLREKVEELRDDEIAENKEEIIITPHEEDESPSPQPQQEVVVVLRVSLHCRGCVKKLRKHLSRMEGIKSFDIDFLAKKVTVTGNVSPADVLSSISKVKNAQLWPPSISSSNPTSQITSLDSNIAGA